MMHFSLQPSFLGRRQQLSCQSLQVMSHLWWKASCRQYCHLQMSFTALNNNITFCCVALSLLCPKGKIEMDLNTSDTWINSSHIIILVASHLATPAEPFLMNKKMEHYIMLLIGGNIWQNINAPQIGWTSCCLMIT